MEEAQMNDGVLTEKQTFIWDKSWVRPYESLWSVLRNFRIVNGFCTNKKAMRMLGITRQYSQCNIHCLNEIVSYANMGFPGNDLQKIKSTLLPDDYEDKLQPLARLFKDDSHIISIKLKYCPACIENGYHSVFHQLSGLDHCFIHRNVSLNIESRTTYIIGFPVCYHWDTRFSYTSARYTRNWLLRKGNICIADIEDDSYNWKLPFEW